MARKKMASLPWKFGTTAIDRRNQPFPCELYTILTNKAAKGGPGSIVAIVAGTKAETVIDVIRKIPESLRKK